LLAARESANRTERELTELAAEVRTVRSGSNAALEALSGQVDAAEERLSREAEEVAALRACVESAQKESALALDRLSLGEADFARLAAEVAALRGLSEGAQKQLAAHEEKLGGFARTEADIARVPSEVAAVEQLRADIAALMDWTKPRSLIIREFPALFEEFRAKRFNLLWRGSHDGFTAATAARTL
jgi:chromosome segregation ATPase